MMSLLVLLMASAFTAGPSESLAFQPRSSYRKSRARGLQSTTVSNPDTSTTPNRHDLKQQLFKLAASFDRGYSATPEARNSVDAIVRKLEQTNERLNIADTVYAVSPAASSVLDGTYRMIWTTALDVLLLEASPVFSTGAIHQVFAGRSVTNVIDFVPRVQSLFPISLNLNSMIRAKVQTRACRPSREDSTGNRVGLIFEAVQVQPVQFFGLDSSMLPEIGFDLPKLPGTGDESPGYFDVLYLDDDLLIIQQSQPGGLFALVRVNSIDS